MPRNGHNWLRILTKERGQIPKIDVAFLPTMCNHCDDAPCMEKDEGRAITKRDDGIVIIDPDRAKGRKDLVEACPYGHIWWNEELQLPQAWPFDAHLLDGGWEKTRGTQSCPTAAMRTVKVDDEEMARMVRDEKLEVLQPELGSKPRIYYKNLWRYTTAFIGGTVSEERSGVVECVEGAIVRLMQDGREIAKVVTDTYGDFKLDQLPEGSSAYAIDIVHAGRRATRDVTLGESVNLGEIRI
jgi:Fe-S-cluster-containing dehydrogenase component